MARTLRFVFAMVALGVLVFALAPRPKAKDVPAPQVAAAPHGPGMLVVDLKDGATDADLDEADREASGDLQWIDADHADGLAEGWVPDLADAVAAVSADPDTEVAEPDAIQEAFTPERPPQAGASGYPNDPMYDKQWHLKAMGAPTGWAETPRGKGVVVAVIDTGVTKVEDLEGTTILAGKSFVPGTSTAQDDNGHGTHVAGTIAQTTNNGKGVAGVAPEATILPVKVLSGGGFGSAGWIASGIDYAVQQKADVINLSLGGGYSLVIHNAIKKANAQGVIVVAAVGNSGREGVSYPGGLAETIGVSATGPDGSLAFYSSWGKGTDIAGPGGDKRKAGGGVLQDTIDGKGGHQYAEFQGTSMATPHVAGAAAILLSTGMEPQMVKEVLLDSAARPTAQELDDAGVVASDGWDPKFGYGRLDLNAALGTVLDRYGAIRFALAAAMALLAVNLAGIKPGFKVISAVTAGVTAGGLFFLDKLPLPDVAIVHILARPFLYWPAILLDSKWVNFPLWLSALIPAAVVFFGGAFKPTRAAALGFVVGIGAHLLHGAATGTLNPWFMPAGLDVLWLTVNGVACMIFALALAGAEKLDGEKR